MHFDVQVEGSQRMAELSRLQEVQIETPSEARSTRKASVVLLRVFALMAGIFFSLLATTAMRIEVAFISITLILIATTVIVLAAEKLIHLLPRKLWIWRNEDAFNKAKLRRIK